MLIQMIGESVEDDDGEGDDGNEDDEDNGDGFIEEDGEGDNDEFKDRGIGKIDNEGFIELYEQRRAAIVLFVVTVVSRLESKRGF
ncbi:10330_t:CDS:2 [Ambispora gerdemannii]|uniref:10330_t:CDS:1 n=1 Tax=Ambispora gerdemannii TaxID=144530 RepID=A0A9N9FNS7_9GLOM|nr:10330_t:CDS:2 [Ambispora gerdemannii]